MIENEYCTFHMENAYSVHSQHIMGKSKYACKTMYNTILQSCFIKVYQFNDKCISKIHKRN